MYTAIKISHADAKIAQRRIVTIKFEDSTIPHEFLKDFSFRLTDTVDAMKKTVQSYLDELNAVPDVLPDGAIDTTITAPVVTPPTQAELDKIEWDANWLKLQTVDKLIAAQILTGLETPVVNLRNKVKADFRQTYL